MKLRRRAHLLFLLTLPAAAIAQQSSTPSTSTPPAPSTSSPSTSSTSSAPTFDSLDTNHDGVLSKDEFKAMVSQTSDQQQTGHGGGHHGGGFGGPGSSGGGGFGGGSPGGGFGGGAPGGGFGGQRPSGGGFGGPSSGGQYGGHHGGHGGSHERENPDQTFENLDTNHDGVLSREEFAAMSHGGSPGSSSSGNYHSANPHATTTDRSPPTN
ncbi:MAG TPA: EF-hand domain-containing protein [Gammaproteobacteria bacterium]|nr:EF-hand domain-containing protein [Gammaproteobacteria bacterium]